MFVEVGLKLIPVVHGFARKDGTIRAHNIRIHDVVATGVLGTSCHGDVPSLIGRIRARSEADEN